MISIQTLEAFLKQGHTVKDICRANGLPYETTYWRWRRAGWKGVGCSGLRAQHKRLGRPAAAWIVAWTAAKHDMPLDKVLSGRRFANIVAVRRNAIVLLRHAGYSMPVIAEHVGSSNHTSVIHHLHVAQDKMRNDPAYARHIRSLKSELDALSGDT